MKNENIKPNQEVPYIIRQEVYKEALEYFEKDKRAEQYSGLCIILPKMLWGLKIDEDITETIKNYRFGYSKNMFPELVNFLKEGTYGYYKNQERIEFLKSVIK